MNTSSGTAFKNTATYTCVLLATRSLVHKHGFVEQMVCGHHLDQFVRVCFELYGVIW